MTSEEKRRNRQAFMLHEKLVRVIMIVSMPQVATMLIDSVYNMADTYFVSRLGSTAIAAVSINDSLMMIIRAISFGFGVGASSFISRLLGAGEEEEASRVASTTLISAFFAAILFSVFSYMALSSFVGFLGATKIVKPYAIQYAQWILLSAPFTAISVCLAQALRAEGSTAFSMIGEVSGCILNVILDPIFISEFNLGVSGAAIATVLSKVCTMCILLIPYRKGKCVLEIRAKLFAPGVRLYSEVAKMGIPAMLRTGLMTISVIMINNMAGSFGDAALVAVAIANKVMRIIGAGVMGFGQGFQPIAGFAWGAKNIRRVMDAFKYTLIIGCVLCSILGVACSIYTKPIIGVFSNEESVLSIGVVLIRTQCFVLPLHMCVLIISNYYQALGKAVESALLGLSRQVLALIPCVIILTRVYGLNGLACSQAAADIAAFIFSLFFIFPELVHQKRMVNGEGL